MLLKYLNELLNLWGIASRGEVQLGLNVRIFAPWIFTYQKPKPGMKTKMVLFRFEERQKWKKTRKEKRNLEKKSNL